MRADLTCESAESANDQEWRARSQRMRSLFCLCWRLVSGGTGSRLIDCDVFDGEDVAMQYRELGRTGWKVSTVSFGAWAIGGAWGSVDDEESLAALHRAIDLGVNFIDTADVYGDGRSERLVAQLRRERSEKIYVATKAGRRLQSAYDRRLQPRESHRVRRAQPQESRRPRRSICCSCTARRTRSTTGRRCSACSTTWWRPASCDTTA